MDKELHDTLDEVYKTKKALSDSFATYDEFAQWLMKEQSAAKEQGRRFVRA